MSIDKYKVKRTNQSKNSTWKGFIKKKSVDWKVIKKIINFKIPLDKTLKVWYNIRVVKGNTK